MTDKVIVIGDVHGCFNTLMQLVAQFPADATLCFVGDLVDRGPRSSEVVEFVKKNAHFCVRGNHEEMMIQYARKSSRPEHAGKWCAFSANGGENTLSSYEGFEELFEEHVAWLEKLPVFVEFPSVKNDAGRKLVVSHSSIGSVWDWPERKRDTHETMFEEIVQWGRNTPVDNTEIYNIFGHTPEPTAKIKSFYANIDTGACFKGREVYGVMTALEFPSMKVYTQENVDE